MPLACSRVNLPGSHIAGTIGPFLLTSWLNQDEHVTQGWAGNSARCRKRSWARPYTLECEPRKHQENQKPHGVSWTQKYVGASTEKTEWKNRLTRSGDGTQRLGPQVTVHFCTAASVLATCRFKFSLALWPSPWLVLYLPWWLPYWHLVALC